MNLINQVNLSIFCLLFYCFAATTHTWQLTVQSQSTNLLLVTCKFATFSDANGCLVKWRDIENSSTFENTTMLRISFTTTQEVEINTVDNNPQQTVLEFEAVGLKNGRDRQKPRQRSLYTLSKNTGYCT